MINNILRSIQLLSDALQLRVHGTDLTSFVLVCVFELFNVLQESFQLFFNVRVFIFLLLILQNSKFEFLQIDLILQIDAWLNFFGRFEFL